MTVQRQKRQIGDTQIAIAAQLKRPDGTAVDVTDLTVKFHMVNAQTGADKVAETSANVSTTVAATGMVQYDPVAADVDTVGTYHAYFVTEDDDGKQDTFPAIKGEFQVVIEDTA